MQQSISRFQQLIEERISAHTYGKRPPELYEPISYLMALGGKRLRPILTLLGYYLFRDEPSKIIDQALAMEVFHNFTLMHDDIMDEAPLRRGESTVHEKWNSNTAILSGDVMLVKVYDLLLKTDKKYLSKALKVFNKCATEVCEGQQLDMVFESRDDVGEEEYLEMIRLKTAVLLGTSLYLGALLAGADKGDRKALYDFGVNIGIGFQLKDDLLDVYANKEKFGKQVGGDIIANKKTFLLIKAKDLASGQNKTELAHWLELDNFDAAAKVKAVTDIYDSLEIKKLTEAKMNEYFSCGFSSLRKLEAAMPRKAMLKEFTEALIGRES
ncbi:MAG: polyprenyl synthetase family protein [Bacteroidota bacterium]